MMGKLILNSILIYLSTDAVPVISESLFTDLTMYSDHITALVIAYLLMPFVTPLFEL
ncbi:hypothetical protein [Solemya pervernicosa gill symbiont]|uniref:hypothetical protein n=1 Tax=Solemya pervernicosa gill symbiont TaxID=642797 RepID=UPI00155F8E89|nr:hypothetical protein [Solemya pervernicosa gill symbiont]